MFVDVVDGWGGGELVEGRGRVETGERGREMIRRGDSERHRQAERVEDGARAGGSGLPKQGDLTVGVPFRPEIANGVAERPLCRFGQPCEKG